MSSSIKIIIVPGNGCTNPFIANWYGWLHKKLTEMKIPCRLEAMPDPYTASESEWIPYMHKELNCDENTIVVGHSSGAEAAMRYAEKYKLKGITLVSGCVTDLGDENERASGYYNRPWLWEEMKKNTDLIIQFGSTDDPFIAWSEQQEIADNLNPELHKFTDKGHFMSSTFPELLNVIKTKLK
ncbi:serine hydrolase RBBP9 [Patella vulgata]|uniref:serine hydrolase RBBP9 n=1 Tax=Patella vulgata TaxID=6465 RepID=UPI0024A7F4F4|nr:serine hydrolase RBBP9 [Patella vulgata]XP_050407069.2 serine hydrolase RBBP9 [Patella vulgata]XP_050407070.2 serine hydrolase RBBP9 [Patella vulgata]